MSQCIIIIIIHEFQSDASPEELQGHCSVTVFSLWLWLVTRTAERPDKQLSLQSAPKTVDSRQRRDRRCIYRAEKLRVQDLEYVMIDWLS